MDLSAFHGQQSGYPNDQGRKEDSDGIGCKGLALLHFKKIGGDTPGIDSGFQAKVSSQKVRYPKNQSAVSFFQSPFWHVAQQKRPTFYKIAI